MKKRFIAGFVSGAVAFGAVGAIAANLTAASNPFPITLNGENVILEGYNIDGYTYFKLRDIADAVGGFDVDFQNDTIVLNSQQETAGDADALELADLKGYNTDTGHEKS